MTRIRRSLLPAAALLLAGCADDLGPTSAELENSVHALLGGMEVGEVLTLSGQAASAVYLAGAPRGADYLYVPFFASEAGEARLQVEVQGTNLAPAVSTMFASEARAADRRRDWAAHEGMLRRSLRELDPRAARAAALRASRSRAAGAARAAVPAQVGALVPLNTAASCEDAPDVRWARVEAVGSTAIIVADTANPGAGLTRGDYEAFVRQFDQLVVPTLIRHFGEPSDVDANERVVVFFTRAVNELTPPSSGSYTAGFFWAGDLFPRDLCPGSNEAEVFYQLVADPAGEINDNTFPTDFVRESTVGVLGHEFQHLINAGRRIYVNDAEALEEVWLNEGLSHIAEEMIFYAASGTQPGGNLDIEDVRGSEAVRLATNAYMFDNLVRYAQYLEAPEEESLLGVDNLPTRGAAWAFLRYASDHDPRSEEEFFRALVDSDISGSENLEGVLGADVVDLMQDWTVSVFTDDYAAVEEAAFQQPSWNFRSILPELYLEPRFPLRVRRLGGDDELAFRLRGGGAAFVTLRSATGGPVSISTTASGRTPPGRLRVSVVRLR